MRSKIVSRSEAKEFQGQKGIIYYRYYELENGESISLGSTENDPKWGQVGMELEYEQNGVNSSGNPKYKRVSQKSFGGGKSYNSTGQVVGMALNNATLAYCHGKIDEVGIANFADRIIKAAKMLQDKYDGQFK